MSQSTEGRYVLPNFAGGGTFLRSQPCDIENVPPGATAVIGLPHDTTAASRPGARWGPSSIRSASAELDYFLRSSECQQLVDIETGQMFGYADDSPPLLDCGDLMVFPLDPQHTVDVVAPQVARLVAQHCVPVGLGGDHFVSYPVCKGVAEGIDQRGTGARLGYIQIDADLDISNDNPTWGSLFHGTNARRVSEIPSVSPTNMVMFGTSGYTRKDQWDFVQEAGVTVISVSEVQKLGAEAAMRRAIDIALDGADALYVSCDIDAVDGAFAPGTGGIKFTGMLPPQLFSAGRVLSEVSELVGVDIVEVAPNLDPTGRTPVIAAAFLAEVLDRRLFSRTSPQPQ